MNSFFGECSIRFANRKRSRFIITTSNALGLGGSSAFFIDRKHSTASVHNFLLSPAEVVVFETVLAGVVIVEGHHQQELVHRCFIEYFGEPAILVTVIDLYLAFLGLVP